MAFSTIIRAEAEQLQSQMDKFIKGFTPPDNKDIVFLAQAIRRLANCIAREAGSRDV